MKTKLSFTFLFFFLSFMAIGQVSLYIKGKDGTNSDYSLADVRKLTFQNSTLTVTPWLGTVDIYDLSSLNYVSFTSITAVDEIITEQQTGCYSLSPNPVQDSFTVQTDVSVSYRILSLAGKVLYSGIANPNQAISISFLPQGIYLCVFHNEAAICTSKLIKH